MWHSPTLGNDLPPVWELVVLAVLLAGMIVAGVWAIIRVRRWLTHDDNLQSAEEDLSSYRQLLEQGLLDKEEFDRLQARLASKVVPPASPPPATPSSTTPSAPLPSEQATKT
jgi:hypothetical protein